MKSHWGEQTELALKNFNISFLPWPKLIIQSLGLIKWAVAKTNQQFKKIDNKVANQIKKTAWLIWEGKLMDQFPLSIWQSGSGTQTNMNINEVIANYVSGNEINHNLVIHANNDVNYAQSTNDTIPSAIQIAAVLDCTNLLLPALDNLCQTFHDLTIKFGHVIKPGRTHYQDATPISYAQEWSGSIAQIKNITQDIKYAIKKMVELPQGGTAVGTGINTYVRFDEKVCQNISDILQITFTPCHNKFHKISSHDDLLFLSGCLNGLATFANKLAQDFKFLTSGPDCGINEILFPAHEKGSSIMAGKVNPTQCEVLSMAAFHLMGAHNVITHANAAGHLQLNTYRPLIGYHLINSIEIISSSLNSFNDKFLKNITVNTSQIKSWINKYKMLSTVLVPHLGYDKVQQIVNYSADHKITILEAVLQLKLFSKVKAQKLLDPKNMINPITKNEK